MICFFDRNIGGLLILVVFCGTRFRAFLLLLSDWNSYFYFEKDLLGESGSPLFPRKALEGEVFTGNLFGKLIQSSYVRSYSFSSWFMNTTATKRSRRQILEQNQPNQRNEKVSPGEHQNRIPCAAEAPERDSTRGSLIEPTQLASRRTGHGQIVRSPTRSLSLE